ncbi:hypothetical protein EGW08_013002, partial [Elysia chlorotica]
SRSKSRSQSRSKSRSKSRSRSRSNSRSKSRSKSRSRSRSRSKSRSRSRSRSSLKSRSRSSSSSATLKNHDTLQSSVDADCKETESKHRKTSDAVSKDVYQHSSKPLNKDDKSDEKPVNSHHEALELDVGTSHAQSDSVEINNEETDRKSTESPNAARGRALDYAVGSSSREGRGAEYSDQFGRGFEDDINHSTFSTKYEAERSGGYSHSRKTRGDNEESPRRSEEMIFKDEGTTYANTNGQDSVTYSVKDDSSKTEIFKSDALASKSPVAITRSSVRKDEGSDVSTPEDVNTERTFVNQSISNDDRNNRPTPLSSSPEDVSTEKRCIHPSDNDKDSFNSEKEDVFSEKPSEIKVTEMSPNTGGNRGGDQASAQAAEPVDLDSLWTG